MDFNQKCSVITLVMNIIDAEKDCGIDFLDSTMKRLNVSWLDLNDFQSTLDQYGEGWVNIFAKTLNSEDKDFVIDIIKTAFVRGGNFNSTATNETVDKILTILGVFEDENKNSPIFVTENELQHLTPIEDIYCCIASGYCIIQDYIENVLKNIKYQINGTLELNITMAMSFLSQYVYDIERIKNLASKQYSIKELAHYFQQIPDFELYLSNPHISSFVLYKSGKVQKALDDLSESIHNLVSDYQGIKYETIHRMKLFKGWEDI